MPEVKALTMYRPLTLSPMPPAPRPAAPALRRLAARLLRRAAARLTWLAHRLAAAPTPPLPPGETEFCATGASEGALFIDGRYIGTLPMTRL